MKKRIASTRRAKFSWLLTCGATLALASSPPVMGAEGHDGHHAHHAHHAASAGYTRTTAAYAMPDVQLVDADGGVVALQSELARQSGPVLVNFIFTTCGAVCPVMSSTFSQVQDALGAEQETVRMLSISIDPEQDTPAALKAYAGRYHAGKQWRMLTGSLADSIAVQRAFGVYRGDKMNHAPATFLRAAPEAPWVRLDGFASADDILRELDGLSGR